MEASSPTTVTVIEAKRGWGFPDVGEVWAYRDLIYFLARRDVVIRYKQAVVGTFWAVLQPLFLAAVFSVFLGLVAKVEGPPGYPYPLFAVTGMIMWVPFTTALQSISESTTTSEALISKIYFPRIVIPLAAVVPAIVDFCFGFVVLIAVAIAYGYPPDLQILAAPVAILLAMTTALGAGLWLSALNVRYRDVHLVVPLLVLAGLFVTPIIYDLDTATATVPASLQPLYALNPMVGVMELFRWAVLGTAWPGALLIVPIAASVVLLVTGTLYFERAQRTFADVI